LIEAIAVAREQRDVESSLRKRRGQGKAETGRTACDHGVLTAPQGVRTTHVAINAAGGRNLPLRAD
jgi:hypothetical protein